MTAVPDVAPPVTMPVALTLAVPMALLLQVPPGVASVNGVVKPEQTTCVPVMLAGNGLIVSTAVT